jgi:hypothetical protein
VNLLGLVEGNTSNEGDHGGHLRSGTVSKKRRKTVLTSFFSVIDMEDSASAFKQSEQL